MNKYQTIGIIGGMGPESTALLYREIITSFQRRFGAYLDADFPEMLIHNLPIPDITSGIEEEVKVKALLSTSASFLERSGATLIAFPCNSLNYFVDYLSEQTSVPIVSIVEETGREIRKRGVQEVLLLSTTTTFDKGLYHRYLGDTTIVRPPDYDKIQDVIVRTLRGECPKKQFIDMLEQDFAKHENIVIGCTDLSLLVEKHEDPRLIDSLQCLSEAVVARAIQPSSTSREKNLYLGNDAVCFNGRS
jgi:aspartate racemase